jgi:hypothetical protein
MCIVLYVEENALSVTSVPQSLSSSLRTILWHIEPLLSNDRETDKETTAIASISYVRTVNTQQ